MKYIIDTDPGTDDVLALILALNSPELDILGLTSVGGNATLAYTTKNSLRVLEYMERPDIPVAKGSSRPLEGKFDYAYHHHGPGGLTVRLPSPKLKAMETRAIDFLVSQIERYQGNISVIALGPLTNVAKAIRQEPRLVDWISKIVVMGGAVNVAGNVTPYAEFNIYDDPLAANEVFTSGVNIDLIGLDVCNDTFVGFADTEWLRGAQTSGGMLSSRILKNWFSPRETDAIYHLCDPLTVASIVCPSLMQFTTGKVTVNLDDEDRIGQTSAEYGIGNVRVATSVSASVAKDFVRDRIYSVQ